MKATLLALLAATIGLTLSMQAQTMVEYSHVATQSAKSLAAPVPEIAHSGSDKVAGSYVRGTKGVKVWQEKNARAKDEAPAKPVPPAVFVLSSGERIEASDYVLTMHWLSVTQNEQQRSIPMSDVNVNATLAANHERGLDLKIPENKGQMTLSF